MIKKLNLLQQNLDELEGVAICNALNNALAECCNVSIKLLTSAHQYLDANVVPSIEKLATYCN